MKASISGIGSYVPERILTNFDFEKMVDTSDEWIRTRSGIRERHVAAADQATSDLALIAGKRALQSAGIKPKEIGAIIVATATPDMLFPSTACLVQAQVGAQHVISFDISAGCTGFLYGLAVGENFVLNGYDNVLVIGADTLTRITDYEDRRTCVLFGDAAGAVVLKKTETEHGIISSYFAANGSYWEPLYQPAGGTRIPASHDSVDRRLHYIKMQGNEVFKLAVRAMAEAAVKTLKKAGIHGSDVDLFIPHQANIRIIEASAKRLHIPMDKVLINLDKYGNTSAASIPLALDQAVQEGRVSEGSLILMIAFGAGFTWGGVLLRY